MRTAYLTFVVLAIASTASAQPQQSRPAPTVFAESPIKDWSKTPAQTKER